MSRTARLARAREAQLAELARLATQYADSSFATVEALTTRLQHEGILLEGEDLDDILRKTRKARAAISMQRALVTKLTGLHT